MCLTKDSTQRRTEQRFAMMFMQLLGWYWCSAANGVVMSSALEVNGDQSCQGSLWSIEEVNIGMQLLAGAQNGDMQKMQEVLSSNATLINFQDEDGYTALHRAAYSDQPTSLEFLLSQNPSLNLRTSDGWTPLHSAARWNAHSALKILLQSGVDINARSNGGQTALHLAGDSGKAECVTLLLLDPSVDARILNDAGDTAEELASRSGSFAYLFDLGKASLNKF